MDRERSAAGATVTVTVALAALIDGLASGGERHRSSELRMVPSPVSDQSLAPSLFFERTSTS